MIQNAITAAAGGRGDIVGVNAGVSVSSTCETVTQPHTIQILAPSRIPNLTLTFTSSYLYPYPNPSGNPPPLKHKQPPSPHP